MSDETEYEVMDVRDVEFLKQRVRELEAALAIPPPALAEAAERIAKARQILESSDGMTQKMKDALAALEGK